MARKPTLPPSDDAAYLHTPIPRPLKARMDFLCADRNLTKAQLVFHAVNELSRSCGLKPLKDNVIDGFSAYPTKAK